MGFKEKGFVILKTVFDVHGKIGKVLGLFCVSAVVAAVIGLPFGLTKCSQNNQVSETNHFIGDEISFHNNNFSTIVKCAKTVEHISVINKTGIEEKLDGKYIQIELMIKQLNESNRKEHLLDEDDFKLKDHTGVYIPFSDILSLVDWNGIDVHFDVEDGGHVMSSADFETLNAIYSQTFCNQQITKEYAEYTIYFASPRNYSVENDLMILEVDFYFGVTEKTRGVDIALLKRI